MKVIKVVFLICCVSIFGVSAQETKQKRTSNEKLPKSEISIKDDSAEIINDQDAKKIKSDTPTDTNVDNQVEQFDRNLTSTVQNNQKDSNYKIGFQDVLTITVYRHPELSQTVSVGQDGTILLPRINQPIIAVCKTERELSNLITELYKNYLRTPFVNVRTQEQRSQPFAVIGAVNKPGSFFLNQRVRLLRLLSLAGGQDVEKAGSRVQIARIGNASGCSPADDTDADLQFFTYALNDVLSGKDNPWMNPGDIVSILEAEQAYVVGDVFEPAKITLKEPITLSEAIAYAGGLSSTSKISQVVIQRKEKTDSVRKDLVFNLKEIRANTAADPVLQGGDIVVVSSSTTKKVKQGLWKMLVNGLPNIFYRIPL